MKYVTVKATSTLTQSLIQFEFNKRGKVLNIVFGPLYRLYWWGWLAFKQRCFWGTISLVPKCCDDNLTFNWLFAPLRDRLCKCGKTYLVKWVCPQ